MIINDKVGEALEIITTYEYSCSMVAKGGKIDMALANRAKKMINIYCSINKTILRKKEMAKKIKLKIYNSIIDKL